MAFEARFHIIAVVMLEDGFPIPCVSSRFSCPVCSNSSPPRRSTIRRLQARAQVGALTAPLQAVAGDTARRLDNGVQIRDLAAELCLERSLTEFHRALMFGPFDHFGGRPRQEIHKFNGKHGAAFFGPGRWRREDVCMFDDKMSRKPM